MLRRQFALCSSSTSLIQTKITGSSFIKSTVALRLNSTSFGREQISPEEAARLEKLARARLAEADTKSPLPRSREIGAPPAEGVSVGAADSSSSSSSTKPSNSNQQNQSKSRYDVSGSTTMKSGQATTSTPSSSSAAPFVGSRRGASADLPDVAEKHFKVERQRDSAGVQSTPYVKPPDAESKSDLKRQQQQPSAQPIQPPSFSSKPQPNRSTGNEGDEKNSNSLQQQKKQPVDGSPLSTVGGTKIVFDVPEGELPQQASYDPWSILGLKPGASGHDLRVRYHELLEQFHPDYVKDGGSGDVQKWAEVDRAYQLVTKAPSHDKRFRNLISDSQLFYYKYLPLWMSRNIDEMPRWWSWARWKLPTFWFVLASLGIIYMIGKIYAYYPRMGIAAMTSFMCDILFHTGSFPLMCGVMMTTLLFSGGNPDMAWLTSPKGFLRRPLQY